MVERLGRGLKGLLWKVCGERDLGRGRRWKNWSYAGTSEREGRSKVNETVRLHLIGC